MTLREAICWNKTRMPDNRNYLGRGEAKFSNPLSRRKYCIKAEEKTTTVLPNFLRCLRGLHFSRHSVSTQVLLSHWDRQYRKIWKHLFSANLQLKVTLIITLPVVGSWCSIQRNTWLTALLSVNVDLLDQHIRSFVCVRVHQIPTNSHIVHHTFTSTVCQLNKSEKKKHHKESYAYGPDDVNENLMKCTLKAQLEESQIAIKMLRVQIPLEIKVFGLWPFTHETHTLSPPLSLFLLSLTHSPSLSYYNASLVQFLFSNK